MKIWSRMVVLVIALLGARNSPLVAQTVTAPAVPDPAAPQTGRWTTGGAIYLLSTFADNSQAFLTTTGIGTPDRLTTATSFPPSFNPGFAVWAGREGTNGTGLRARYFLFTESSPVLQSSLTFPDSTTTNIAPSGPLVFPPGTPTFNSPGVILAAGFGTDELQFQRSLTIHAIDGEVTMRHGGERLQAQIALGGRFMNLQQDYAASLNNTVNPGVLSEDQRLTFQRLFNGGGPLLGVQLDSRIGRTSIYGYALARAGVLAGYTSERLLFTQDVVDVGGVAGGPQTVTNIFDDGRGNVIPVGEIEVGFRGVISPTRMPLTFSAASVAQTYFNAGSAVDQRGNLYLFGVQISVGFDF